MKRPPAVQSPWSLRWPSKSSDVAKTVELVGLMSSMVILDRSMRWNLGFVVLDGELRTVIDTFCSFSCIAVEGSGTEVVDVIRKDR